MLAERKAYVQLKARTPLKPQSFRAAIESAGQKARAFELRVCAAVEVEGSRYYLRPGGVDQRFAASGADAARRLDPFAGSPVCVKGSLVSIDPPMTLEITEVSGG